MRRDVVAVCWYAIFLTAVILLYSALFQLIMVQVEGQSHSWITAVYWTLVTMSTLGFGDVTFSSDIGRVFSLGVLISGVLLLLVVLPFTFIRFFYAPWLETQFKLRAPRKVPLNIRGHVIISRYDETAVGLIERLKLNNIPHYVINSDPVESGHLWSQGVSVVTGDIDNLRTYEALQVQHARLLLVNCEDTTNTNIALTVREISNDLPIVGIAEQEDSIDILELSGCTQVLPLKIRLGEYLANRVSAIGKADVIGNFRKLQIAELSVRGTPLSGLTVRDTQLRERTGLNIVGVWCRGRLLPAFPHTVLSSDSMVVVVGVSEQLAALNSLLDHRRYQGEPVIIVGAGKVGTEVTRALKRKGMCVNVVECNPGAEENVSGLADRVVIGNANDRKVLEEAGLDDASAVLLSTHDDATNVYLSIYCRRLKPDIRIASRITHERNLEAIHRAGADFVLSCASLGVEAIMSLIEGHELVMLGEGVDLFEVQVPASLVNVTLAESGIGSRTGLSVVAVQQNDQLVTSLKGSMQLVAGAQLVMLGSVRQRRKFSEVFD